MQMGEEKEEEIYSCKFGSFIQEGKLPDRSLYDKSLQTSSIKLIKRQKMKIGNFTIIFLF
jgi:hypothetical protein